MFTDELEFSISQYVDGSLPTLESAALEERLASDADLRRLLAEYERMHAILKVPPALPEINWKLLAAHLSDAVAAVDAPVRNYSMRWAWATRTALAAAVLLAAGVFFRAVFDTPTATPRLNALPVIAVIEGPKMEIATGGAKVGEIAIGPADETAELNSRYADTIISRPTRVVIASGIDENDPSLHDGPALPY